MGVTNHQVHLRGKCRPTYGGDSDNHMQRLNGARRIHDCYSALRLVIVYESYGPEGIVVELPDRRTRGLCKIL